VTTLKSNAFINVPNGASSSVEKLTGTITAGYNSFFHTKNVNYLGGVTSTTDLNGGAQTDPKFAGPLPTKPFDMNEVQVWKRELKVGEVLLAYRCSATSTASAMAARRVAAPATRAIPAARAPLAIQEILALPTIRRTPTAMV
jgi:hypothetical protein